MRLFGCWSLLSSSVFCDKEKAVFNYVIMLTEEQVRHVAKLARFKLTDKEVGCFTRQLSEVLDYIEVLNEVDTENVEPTYQVTGLKNVLEKDEVIENVSREEMLRCSAHPVELSQIRVKAAISSE